MIDAFTLGLFAVAATGCGLLAARVILAAEARRHRETFRLTFPRSADPGEVTAALRSVQGLLPRFPTGSSSRARSASRRSLTLPASLTTSPPRRGRGI